MDLTFFKLKYRIEVTSIGVWINESAVVFFVDGDVLIGSDNIISEDDMLALHEACKGLVEKISSEGGYTLSYDTIERINSHYHPYNKD
jgi:hypothetical protein